MTRHGKGENGSALILALLAILLITAIGMGMMYMSNNETNIAANFRDAQAAMYAADGGLEETRDRMLPSATNSVQTMLPTGLPGAAGGVLYVTDGTSQPWVATDPNPDAEICSEGVNCASLAGGWYAQTTASPAYAASPALPWKWVRVMAKTDNAEGGVLSSYSVDGGTGNNRVCWNGVNESVTTAAACPAPLQPVYSLTALAVTPSGSRRMLQMEVAHDAPIDLPAAITLDTSGQSQCQIQGTGNPTIVTGVDQNPSAPPNSGVAGIAINNGSCPIQGGRVLGAPPYTNSPSVYNLPMPNDLLPGPNLTNTIAALVAQADNVFAGNPPAGANLGTCSGNTFNPLVTVINAQGTLINGLTGCGVLLIEAGQQTQLELNGNITWKGPVIVYSSLGQVQVQIDTGNGRIDGGLLMASDTGAQIQVQYQGNGPSGGINYNSMYLNYKAGQPLRVIARREIMK